MPPRFERDRLRPSVHAQLEERVVRVDRGSKDFAFDLQRALQPASQRGDERRRSRSGRADEFVEESFNALRILGWRHAPAREAPTARSTQAE